MQLKLKELLKELGISQNHCASQLGISAGTLSDILNHKRFPKSWDALKPKIMQLLQDAGITPDQMDQFDQPMFNHQEAKMLFNRQTLQFSTKTTFGLKNDPFRYDINEQKDIYVSDSFAIIFEALQQNVRHGGFLAIIGESGSGKTTLVQSFEDWAKGHHITFIRPSVLTMDENDVKGKTLKVGQLIEAIFNKLGQSMPRSIQKREEKLKEILIKDGKQYTILIEEAHCLPLPTLKHLKRFAELKNGFKPLLSIVLIGQTELKHRLSVHNPEVREVAQRVDIFELKAIDNIAHYLEHKFNRIGVKVDTILDKTAIQAIENRLSVDHSRGKKNQRINKMYPLSVANLVTAAMNKAAEDGIPIVTNELIQEVLL